MSLLDRPVPDVVTGWVIQQARKRDYTSALKALVELGRWLKQRGDLTKARKLLIRAELAGALERTNDCRRN